MDKSKPKPKRRATVLSVRRYNCMTPPPAYVAPAKSATQDAWKRVVGKSGEVRIAQLPQGANVTVVQATEQIFIVSSLPEKEVRAIANALPQTPQSPYEALSTLLDARRHEAPQRPIRHAYSEPITVPQISEEEAIQNQDIPTRRRAPR